MTVIRKSRKKNNFVILDKEALWNPQLSNKAVGLWARCMSRPDDWSFHVKELQTKIKESKTAIYSALEELIKHKYVMVVKACTRKNGKFIAQTHEYIFFEGSASNEQIEQEIDDFKQKFDEIYWEIGEFKKFYRLPGFGDPGNVVPDNRDSGNVQLLNIDNTKTDSTIPLSEDKEKKYTKGAPLGSPPSAEAADLCALLLSKNRERVSDYELSKKQEHDWHVEMDRLLRIDKKTPERVRQAIIFASEHKYYKSAASQPKGLRKHFNDILMAMNANEEARRVHANRAWALSMKEQYPQELKGLSFDEKFVTNAAIGKEAPFSLPEEQFKRVFASLFGARYDE